MQFLARRLGRAAFTPKPIVQTRLAITPRTFSTVPRLQIKEDHPQEPEELDRKKREHLEEQRQGKGRWNEELASAGESNIAADRQEVHDHDAHMEDLQKETAAKHQQDHPHGKKQ